MPAADEPQPPAYLTASRIITYAVYIWVWLGIILLGLRVFLLAFSASSSAPFVNFIFRTSAAFLEPFRGIFPPQPVSRTGFVDIAALFAIIIYGLIGWGLAGLIRVLQVKINVYCADAEAEAARRRQAATQRHEVTVTEKTTNNANSEESSTRQSS